MEPIATKKLKNILDSIILEKIRSSPGKPAVPGKLMLARLKIKKHIENQGIK